MKPLSEITERAELPPPFSPTSPHHYNTGGIETIDYIRAKLSPEQFVGYCLGNVLKYVSRWQHKDGKRDLEKAVRYLEWAVAAAD